MDFTFVRWHGWAWSHKSTDLFRSQRRLPPDVDPGVFRPLLARLAEENFSSELEGQALNLNLPNEGEAGLTLRVNGERFQLYAFPDQRAADDFCFAKAHTLRGGRFVIDKEGAEGRH
ncbi:MAG: hypothetical protein IIC18_08685 [Bacteroidetes bacterium]|nr:hypothetical protein [Bacteroidota bacterium]